MLATTPGSGPLGPRDAFLEARDAFLVSKRASLGLKRASLASRDARAAPPAPAPAPPSAPAPASALAPASAPASAPAHPRCHCERGVRGAIGPADRGPGHPGALSPPQKAGLLRAGASLYRGRVGP